MVEKEKPVRKRQVKGQQVFTELVDTMGYEAINLLSTEHERFCWYYATYGNGRAAYQYAYPSVSNASANAAAARLLANDSIIKRLDEIRLEMKERHADITRRVVDYHAGVLMMDHGLLLDAAGVVIDLHLLPPEIRSLLDIDIQMVKGKAIAVASVPKRKEAAAELARIHGLYKDKLQLTGDVAQMSEEEMKTELARLAKETLDELNAAAGVTS